MRYLLIGLQVEHLDRIVTVAEWFAEDAIPLSAKQQDTDARWGVLARARNRLS